MTRAASALLFAAVTTSAVALPTVTDRLNVQDYVINLRAELTEAGEMRNVYLAILIPRKITRIGNFFKGPGKLESAEVVPSSGALKIVFANSNGTREMSILSPDIFGLRCIKTENGYNVCISSHSQDLQSGFGSNFYRVIVEDLSRPASCLPRRARSVGRAVVNQNPTKLFSLEYSPNTFESYNIDPISSLRIVKFEGKSFVEIKGTYGVYVDLTSKERRERSIEKQLTTEYLSVDELAKLSYSNGECPRDNGPLGG